MTYNTIMALADRFIIKLADFKNQTNPGNEPVTQAPAPKRDEMVELSPELEEMARRFHQQQQQNPITSNPAMTGAGPQPTPQESELATKVDQHALSIELGLESDYQSLKTIKYFEKRPKETMFMRYFGMKFHELRMAEAHVSPYSFYGKVIQLLKEAPPPNLVLFNQTKNKKSSTNKDNIEKIYYESYADILSYNREMGFGGNRSGSLMRGLKLRGLKMILDFEYWFEEASR